MSSPAFPPGTDLSKIPSGNPPPGVTPNFTNPETFSTAIIAVSATSSLLAFVLLCARLYSNIRVTRSVGSDDYTAVTALIFSLVFAGLYIHIRSFARHIWDLPASGNTADFVSSIFACQIVGSLALMFAKFSILILLFRIFSQIKGFRYAIYFGASLTAIISATSIVVDGALCAPRAGESFGDMRVSMRCSRETIWAVVQGTLNVVLDFYIFCLPLPIVWKLQLAPRRKIGLSVIFMTALIACGASICALVYKAKLTTSSDVLWNSFTVAMCNIAEINIAIMVSCMPACAAFSRYFTSSIKSRISNTTWTGTVSSANSVGIGSSGSNGSNGRYWRLKSPFRKEEVNERITSREEESQILRTVEFDLVTNKVSPSEQHAVAVDEERKVKRDHDMV